MIVTQVLQLLLWQTKPIISFALVPQLVLTHEVEELHSSTDDTEPHQAQSKPKAELESRRLLRNVDVRRDDS